MNGKIFLEWLSNNLIPAFKEKYPNKTMVLVLDNAKYHHVRGPDYISPSQLSKPEAIATLKKFGINTVTVERPDHNACSQNITFQQTSFHFQISRLLCFQRP